MSKSILEVIFGHTLGRLSEWPLFVRGLVMTACVVLVVASSPSVQAQGNYAGLTADVAVPSPTASSLGEYGDIPVSLYTGRVSIEVPIYSLQSYALSVPISLSYHGGGVRVTEAAGAAGLGWTLNAGGAITRVMRGLPDDVRDGYLYTRGKLDAVWNDLGGSTFVTTLCIYQGQTFDHLPSKYVNGLVGFAYNSNCGPSDPIHNYYDSLPDVFAFNFGGYSGKFVVEPTGIRTIPHQNLKISYAQGPVDEFDGNIESWTVVTEDGTKYIFAETEGYQQTGNYSTAWYVTQIQSGTGSDVIDFTYTGSGSYSDPIAQVEADLHRVQQWDNPIGQPTYPTIPMLQSPSGPVFAGIEETYVQTITTSTGASVEFSLGGRDDLSGLKRYSSILVKSESGARIQRIALDHGYFNDGASIPGGGQWPSRQMERLRLDAVQVYGETDASTVPGYAFEYFGDTSGPTLPKVTSISRDHWGYYNGKVGETLNNLVPSFRWGGTLANPTIEYVGADRDPDATGLYMQAGSLSRVTYPTGGSTSFEYEPHTYSKIGIEEVSNFDADVLDASVQSSASVYEGPGTNTSASSFSVISNWNIPVSIQIAYDLFVEDGTSVYELPRVELWQGTTLVWSADANSSELNVNSSTQTADGDQQIVGFGSVSVTGISTGTVYELRALQEGVSPGSGCNPLTCEAGATATWFNKVLQAHPHTLTAGGLRIKRTVNSDGVSAANDVVTEYEYMADEDIRVMGSSWGLPADRSSGVLVRSPRYLVFSHPSGMDDALRAYGSDVNPTGMGTHIGYRQVTVSTPGQGKSVHFFLAADGLYPDPSSLSVVTSGDGDGSLVFGLEGRYYETSRDWKRGLPTRTLQFDEAGNLLRETRQGYTFSDEAGGSSFPLYTVRGLSFELEPDVYAPGARYVTFFKRLEFLSAVALPSVMKTITYE